MYKDAMNAIWGTLFSISPARLTKSELLVIMRFLESNIAKTEEKHTLQFLKVSIWLDKLLRIRVLIGFNG